MPDAGAQSFTLANGQAANALNGQFATLSPSSSCTAGQNACIGGQFAQCANGAFVQTPCAPGTSCFALPLVNSPGTSVTCSTQADHDARIAATGAGSAVSSREISAREASASVQKKNGQAANALNSHFATLNAGSSCTSGENACVNGDFAQCVNGKFVLSPCAAGLTCTALPLVNSPGTSIACDTQADATARVQASGA
ncbi:hypothetical protein K439DRAFT_1330579 [Ramaria rubella]|nr:hypothetical protein K439DRAFT_1330579 [Ramaria rubella]